METTTATLVEIQDNFARIIDTYFGQIRIIEQITFGDMLVSFLLVIMILLLTFLIVIKVI